MAEDLEVEDVVLSNLSSALDEDLQEKDVDAISVGWDIYDFVAGAMGFEPIQDPEGPAAMMGEVPVFTTRDTPDGIALFEDEDPVAAYRVERDDVEWTDPLAESLPQFVVQDEPLLSGAVLIYRTSRDVFGGVAFQEVFKKITDGGSVAGQVVCHPDDVQELAEQAGDLIDFSTNTVFGAAVQSSEDVERGTLWVLSDGMNPSAVKIEPMKPDEGQETTSS